MIDLTQKILELDKENMIELSNAKMQNIQAIREIDFRTDRDLEEMQHRFEAQKKDDMNLLSKKFDKNRKQALDTLHTKMKDFEKNVKIDQLVEHLVAIAKDTICR